MHLKELLQPGVEILVVDDGSKDKTRLEVEKADVLCCALPCNLGYARALTTGLLYGLSHSYEWFAFMDADGQHRSEDMNQVIDFYKREQVDLVVGSRWLEEKGNQSTVGRRMGMKFFSWLTEKLTGESFTDTTSGMKLMNRKVANELLNQNFGDFHSEIIIYLHDRGYCIKEYPIYVEKRQEGTSMYSFQDVILYPLKNLILIFIFKLNSWTLQRVKH